MGKKILIINSSFRKKNTYNVLKQVAEILKNKGFETEMLHLSDYEIRDCNGCDVNCVKHDNCIQKDDMTNIIMPKVLECDGIIFSSPVYLNGVTSRFKAYADRTNIWAHKPELAGKPVLFVTTTATTGLKETNTFFDQYAEGIGARKGGFICRNLKNMKEPVKEKELAKFIKLLEKDKKTYRPSMNEIVLFEVKKVLAMKSGEKDQDHIYWQKNSLNDKVYYFDCKMNLLKKGFSKMMFKILMKKINI